MGNVITNVLESFIENARRKIKVKVFGKNDVREPFQVSAFGEDSVPIPGLRAIYAPTEEQGKNVIIGYINTNLLAGVGEKRLFSTDEDGQEQAYLWLRNDGNLELQGDDDNAVRFSELKTAFDELNNKFNDHVQDWNLFAAAYVPGSGGAPPTAGTSQPSNADIDPAQIDNIKVPSS